MLVEHNLASVKKFHQSNTFKLRIFHFDTTKELKATDTTYLASVLSKLSFTRQAYGDMRSKARRKINIATLQRVIDDIIEIRSHLDRTRLSRTRYIKLRRYTNTIRLRLQRIIDK